MLRVSKDRNDFLSSEFSFYNLDEYFEVSQINPNVKYNKRVIGNFEVIIADDFLLYPEAFRDFLKKFPGFSNSKRDGMARPGYSQKFHPELFRNLEYNIYKLMNIDTKKQYTEITWASNIMHSNMKTYKPSWIPHYDARVAYVMNYWMCDGMGRTGTAFYEFKGHKKMDHVGSKLDEEYRKSFVENSLDYKLNSTWKNCENELNDDWKLHYISKVKFNRAVFYDPYFFHSPHIEPNSYLEDYRYSLVGFVHTNESIDR